MDNLVPYLRDQYACATQILSIVNTVNTRIVQNNAILNENINERNRVTNRLNEIFRNSELQANNQLGLDLVAQAHQNTNRTPYFQEIHRIALNEAGPATQRGTNIERYTSLLETIPLFSNSTINPDNLKNEIIKNTPISELIRPSLGFKPSSMSD